MQKLILMASLALALAACGNSGSKSDTDVKPMTSPTAAPTSVPTPTPTTTPDVSTDSTGPVEATLDYASLPAPYNTASQEKGEKVFRQCIACHRIDDTGKHKTGPNLHGIIGKTAGTIADFNYSKANKESGVVWTPEVLDEYLTNPRAFMPGTRMSFAGLRRDEDRLEVIAYMMAKSAKAEE